ncbi:putative 1-acylglycerol-3-phosphate O-acyltransferase [Medicago truncatula]|uniref:1-acylglycerol-3-phosphate O-acyltransferase n=1 Tax=Medicago truncatula TaxID=3880 RepID=A0A396JHE7_MEDTR|nr:1-acyl-sn-glycerol-3-phosphate acyltransferase 3-like isoform X1 [Medicago truncatula]RHN76141.1 putative 1-acylglycerol-3-phosphate O-acyltransferase [Medicago truncatula]
MAFPATIVILPVGIIFILSGLIINVIQAIFFVFVRPISRYCYRRINNVLTESLWLELIWLIDWWAGVKVELYADSETFQLMGKENALLICNHRSDIDWLIGWVLAQRTGCLGSTIAIMKKEFKYLPVIGWSMWFAEYLFLERNWAKDESSLKSGFKLLEHKPVPFWVALFVEGTRFTHTKLLAAQEFAISRGIPVPKNVLIPRTKGFVTAVKETRKYIPAIYDCTFTVPRGETSPTLLRIFKGIPSKVKVQIKRHEIEELPETEDGIAQWCKDAFVAKDALLEKYSTTEIFSELELHQFRRPKRSIFVMACWSSFLCFLLVKFFQWTKLLSTWHGIFFAVLFMVIVTAVMEILIHATQAESSKPTNLPIQDPIKQGLLDSDIIKHAPIV